jgi:hypothetical protein
MSGKRTNSLHLPEKLRVDQELGDAIRAIASRNVRTLQGQILFWVLEGVNKEKEANRGKEFRQVASSGKEKPA